MIDIVPGSAGILIESPNAVLRREAKAAHEAWLADPSQALRHDYAVKLRRYGKAIGNSKMVEHANSLLTDPKWD